MRAIFVLISTLALLPLSVSFALWSPTLPVLSAQSNSASPTSSTTSVTITAAPGIVWQPPPEASGGIPRPILWLTTNFMGKITRLEISPDGKLKSPLEAISLDGRCKLEAAEGTKILTAGGLPADKIVVEKVMVPPSPPPGSVIIGDVYDFTPSGITFKPPARLVLAYNPDELPENTSSVTLAHCDLGYDWIEIDCVVEVDCIAAPISHFAMFAILAKLASPASFETSNLAINPSQAQLNQEITIGVEITNSGGTSGDYSLDLKVDGVIKETSQITLLPGGSQRVNFTTVEDAIGKHHVEVAGLRGEFEIFEPTKPPPSGINWWLISGILGAAILVAMVLLTRKKYLGHIY